jgi:hypothetical protein
MPVRRTGRAALVAGAAGTLALQATTYVDMAATGCPPSDLPERAAGRLARTLRVDLASRRGEQAAAHRRNAIGGLLGHATGMSVAIAYAPVRRRLRRPPTAIAGVALGLSAMAAAELPSVATGLTDPRTWGVRGWVSDPVPHLVYGLVTAAAFDLVAGSDGAGRDLAFTGGLASL